jgi:3-hydroxybutyryl-CoA dehydratase
VAPKLRERTLLDFEEGTIVETRGRTVTEADIGNHAGLTWDFYPLHTDEEFARTTRFGSRIAHGPLVYTMSIGLMPIDFFGDAIKAFVGVDELRHLAPVYAGDTIAVRATVTESRPTSSGTSGLVKIEYETRNQHGDVVLKFTGVFLMRLGAA